MKNLVRYDNFRVNYSAKANTNLSILRILRDEGLLVDAMSPGEIAIEELLSSPMNNGVDQRPKNFRMLG